jgi:hypothetical protein
MSPSAIVGPVVQSRGSWTRLKSATIGSVWTQHSAPDACEETAHMDVTRLKTVPLFRGLSNRELERLATWVD